MSTEKKEEKTKKKEFLRSNGIILFSHADSSDDEYCRVASLPTAAEWIEANRDKFTETGTPLPSPSSSATNLALRYESQKLDTLDEADDEFEIVNSPYKTLGK